MIARVRARLTQGSQASWRLILLFAIPAPALAFLIGLFFEVRSQDPTLFDLVSYPAAAIVLVGLELLLLTRAITYARTASIIISVSAVFFFAKLLFLLFFYDGPNLHAQLTETFFWIPACFILAVFVPKAQLAHVISSLFFGALSFITLGYIWLLPEAFKQAELSHALIQMTLANLTFYIVNSVFITMRDSLARTHTELSVMERLAHTDQLTQIPNRFFFEAAIAKGVAKNDAFAVCFIDLDNFKQVNDTLGHLVGDQLLIEATERMKQHLRERDLLARVSGDEFVLMLNLDAARGAPQTAVARIVGTLGEPFHIEGHRVETSASAGISLFPDDGGDAETLLRRADIAMYQAKTNGKDTVQCFSAQFELALQRKRQLAHDLKGAVARGELRVLYQPIFHLDEHRAVKFEALLRWQHPTLGLVSPGEFIPVAESNGAIRTINLWALGQACQQLGNWQRQHGADVHIAVNVSPVWFASATFEAEVDETLSEHRLEPKWLELELTEGVLIGNLARSKQRLARLRARGVRIAIDDFGTGYSSLSYLKHFEVDTLKIDRSFISDLSSTRDLPHVTLAVFEALAALARTLDIDLVAEGIETKTQLDIARSFGTRLGQGYYFAEALSPEACLALLQRPREGATSATGASLHN